MSSTVAQLETAASQNGAVPPARTWRRGALALVAVWGLLIAWRWSMLASPPYWDSAMGLFVEANYLVESNFDYASLALEQPRFSAGGPAIYVISIAPTLLALLMKCCPTPTAVFVVYRLVVLACATGMLLAIYDLAAPRGGRLGATALAAAIVTTPLFNAQLDMLGMDLPMAAAATVALWCACRERYLLATLAAVLSFAIKITGGPATLAVIVAAAGSLWLLHRGSQPRQRSRRWIGLALALAALSVEKAVLNWKSSPAPETREQWSADFTAGWSSLQMLDFWAPDVGLLVAATFAGCGLASVVGLLQARRGARPPAHSLLRGWGRAKVDFARTAWRDYRHVPLCLGIVLMTLLAMTLMYTIPRYLTLAVALLYLAASSWLFYGRIGRSLATVGLWCVAGFNLLNLDGRYYSAIGFEHRTGAFLERSREYLADHQANIALVRLLEREHSGAPIIAGAPWVHFLSMPRLGYVAQPLSGYSLNAFHRPSFPPLEELFQSPPAVPPILVCAENRFSPVAMGTVPPPREQDEVLFQALEPTPLVAYRPRFEPGLSPQELADRYELLLQPGREFLSRGAKFAAAGKINEALACYKTALDVLPDDAETHYHLAELLRAIGQREEAVTHYQRVFVRRPEAAEARGRLVSLLRELGRTADAAQEQRELAAQLPQDAQAQATLGELLGELGEYEPAAEAYFRSLELDDRSAAAQFGRGLALWRLGRRDDALVHLQQSVVIDPQHAAAHYQLALAAQERRDLHAAVEHLRSALRARPAWSEAANDLAWILATTTVAELRRPVEAVEWAEAACRQQEDHPSAALFDTLAAAYAAAGRFDDAVSKAQQAIDLAGRQNQPEVAAGAAERLEKYRQRQAIEWP